MNLSSWHTGLALVDNGHGEGSHALCVPPVATPHPLPPSSPFPPFSPSSSFSFPFPLPISPSLPLPHSLAPVYVAAFCKQGRGTSVQSLLKHDVGRGEGGINIAFCLAEV